MTPTLLGIGADEIKVARALCLNKKLPDFSVPKGFSPDNLFLCEGLWAAEKLVNHNLKILYFFFCPEMIKTEKEQALTDLLCKNAMFSYSISQKACAKISDRDGADGFFTVAEMPEYSLDDIKLKDNMTVIILDGQEQPGNIGAILRSLDAAGGDFAVMTNTRVKLTHSRLIRSSLGAAFTMPVVDVPMDSLFKWLEDNDFKVVVTDLTAKKFYYDVDFSGRIAIVAGNEYCGITPLWRSHKNSEPVIIPMLGECESLNVGFASTLVAYECSLRQRGMISRK